jgi:hypothetical protein
MRYDVGRLSVAAAWLPQAFMTEFQVHALTASHACGRMTSGGKGTMRIRPDPKRSTFQLHTFSNSPSRRLSAQ